MTKIILKKGKEQSLERYHLWLFSGAIESYEGKAPEDGDIVDIFNSKKEFVARGLCSLGSIAVRVLTFEQEQIDLSWWIGRINTAYQMRKTLAIKDGTTTCYRLVHGEGDGLPGLVVDIYDKVAVMQAHCAGIYIQREVIAQAIKDVMQNNIDAIYDKSSGTLPSSSEIEAKDGFILGDSGKEATVLENNLKFNVNWHEGQKTGFFIDQRNNRDLVRHYSKDKRVLNTFCYTGGFSVYALAGGAKEVVSVDSSAKAIELSCKNVEINFPTNNAPHIGITIDAFSYLKELENQKFDLIILDPPAFAKHQKATTNALQGYKRINLSAIKNIAPGGILFTFSCSQAITKEQFRNAVFSAAAIAGRNVKILHFLSQPEDHPINIYHPESEYLKGLVVYVE